MNSYRRSILKGASSVGVVSIAAATGLLKPTTVLAAEWNKAGFSATDLGAALASVGGGSAAASGEITIKAPDIAENGAVVPVEVISSIPGTESITVVGEKNNFPLIGDFKLMHGAAGYVSTRVKLGATSNVVAIVKAGGKTYKAHKEVKVTVGGCGG